MSYIEVSKMSSNVNSGENDMVYAENVFFLGRDAKS